MRVIHVATILITLAFAGCIGGEEFAETSSTDLYGNEYTVFQSDGRIAKDGAVVDGISARERLLSVEEMAREWAEDAHLFLIVGAELAEDATIGPGQFTGPAPSNVQYDKTPGDGLAPAWSYLFLSHEKLSECEFLFVYAAYNDFIVSYTFDPSEANIPDGDEDLWGCNDHTPVFSEARFTVDSDGAAVRFGELDDRYATSTATAEVVTWVLTSAPQADPEDEAAFDTMWITGIFQDSGFDMTPEGFLTCFTPATNTPGEEGCFSFDEFVGTGFDDEGDEGDEEEEVVPDPVEPESGTGTVDFGFIFSPDQEDAFSFTNESHPRLEVDLNIEDGQVHGAYSVDLVDPEGNVVDTYPGASNSGTTNTLSVDDPIAGEWKISIHGEGTPEASYSWCAQGYDYANETVIDCA